MDAYYIDKDDQTRQPVRTGSQLRNCHLRPVLWDNGSLGERGEDVPPKYLDAIREFPNGDWYIQTTNELVLIFKHSTYLKKDKARTAAARRDPILQESSSSTSSSDSDLPNKSPPNDINSDISSSGVFASNLFTSTSSSLQLEIPEHGKRIEINISSDANNDRIIQIQPGQHDQQTKTQGNKRNKRIS